MSKGASITEGQPGSAPTRSVYRRLFGNRVLLALWSGQAISTVGDVFFNIAAMWVVYTQSHSTLQTAVIQAIWHLPGVLLGPFAGAWVDRWDRKRVMWTTNILSAAVVGAVAALMSRQGALSPLMIFVAVFLLNSLDTFFGPARFSVMPQVVGRDSMAAASGLFTTIRQAAYFLGAALAGGVIAVAGAAWAVACDAVSFLAAAACILAVPLPERTTPVAARNQRPALWRELADGWRAIADQPVVRAMVWLNLLINVPSFLGPLMPALVSQRLHGGASAYGALEAVSVIGAAAGGAVAGLVERRIGAGRMLATGWGLAGACTVGMAVSTAFPLTTALEAASAFVLTMGGVSMGALTQALVPEPYRSRVSGTTRALSVATIPVSALLGGWLTDQLGPAPLFAVGGAWILGCAGLAWSSRHVRTARIE